MHALYVLAGTSVERVQGCTSSRRTHWGERKYAKETEINVKERCVTGAGCVG